MKKLPLSIYIFVSLILVILIYFIVSFRLGPYAFVLGLEHVADGANTRLWHPEPIFTLNDTLPPNILTDVYQEERRVFYINDNYLVAILVYRDGHTLLRVYSFKDNDFLTLNIPESVSERIKFSLSYGVVFWHDKLYFQANRGDISVDLLTYDLKTQKIDMIKKLPSYAYHMYQNDNYIYFIVGRTCPFCEGSEGYRMKLD